MKKLLLLFSHLDRTLSVGKTKNPNSLLKSWDFTKKPPASFIGNYSRILMLNKKQFYMF